MIDDLLLIDCCCCRLFQGLLFINDSFVCCCIDMTSKLTVVCHLLAPLFVLFCLLLVGLIVSCCRLFHRCGWFA